ncbi:MAG: DUF3180 domain-containing protein, partial [Propionibacteriaceae bacterium]|jgi:hypothetical protein|nr:DUF3180 domain-containing protein [Propionibacteriaceae bacterium]
LSLLGAAGQPQAALSWLTPIVLAAAGGLAAGGAWFAHRRFHLLRRYPDPRAALAAVALAKACAVVGAASTGAYAVLAVVNGPRFDSAPGPRQRVIIGAASALAAIVLMAGGLLLERECQINHGGAVKREDADGDRNSEDRAGKP